MCGRTCACEIHSEKCAGCARVRTLLLHTFETKLPENAIFSCLRMSFSVLEHLFFLEHSKIASVRAHLNLDVRGACVRPKKLSQLIPCKQTTNEKQFVRQFLSDWLAINSIHLHYLNRNFLVQMNRTAEKDECRYQLNKSYFYFSITYITSNKKKMRLINGEFFLGNLIKGNSLATLDKNETQHYLT